MSSMPLSIEPVARIIDSLWWIFREQFPDFPVAHISRSFSRISNRCTYDVYIDGWDWDDTIFKNWPNLPLTRLIDEYPVAINYRGITSLDKYLE